MDAAAWGLVGTLVGAAASIGTTWIANTFSFRMHSDKQQEERLEKAKEFQRTTLLDLQEALYDAIRLTGRAHHEDFMAYKSGTEWGKGRLTDEVSAGLLAVNRRVAILIERVENTELRSAVKAFTAQMTHLIRQTEKDEAELLLEAVTHQFSALVEKLGTVLRSYY